MSDDLVKRLRNTPNWMREEYAHYKDGLKVFDRAPFEAAYALEAQAARIAALEAAVTQCRTLSAMLKPQADRIAELEAALQKIADTDPDDGTNWFHDVANRALKRGKKDG